mmetsp:Transcript_1276/g.3722  ORF Transcript_1276/g.3722 Transcript_1276/m.3722 type:complete len:320 (-) Transcript_1276:538-1497(-)
MTSSPGPMPMASSARCRPAVAELTAMHSICGSPRNSANACSKRLALGPVVIQPDFRVSTTSAISSSPRSGRANGRKGSKGWALMACSCAEGDEVFGACATHAGARHTAVEADEAQVVAHGQREEVGIGHLARAGDVCPVQHAVVEQAEVVGEEAVGRVRRGFEQALAHGVGGLGIGVAGLAEDAQAAVLRQRAGGPACFPVRQHPGRGAGMVEMRLILQGQQHIDVEQGSHQMPAWSRKRLTSSSVTTAPGLAVKGRNPGRLAAGAVPLAAAPAVKAWRSRRDTMTPAVVPSCWASSLEAWSRSSSMSRVVRTAMHQMQ